MDWRIKLLGQKVIDVCLPDNLSTKAHDRIQTKKGIISNWNESRIIHEKTRGLQMAQFFYESTSTSLDGKRILELGSGWHLTEPILFYLLGADEVWTYDQSRFVKWELVKKQIDMFPTQFDMIEKKCGVTKTELENRHNLIKRADTLDEFLTISKIHYIAPCTFHLADLPFGYFDLFYSYSTLQRVPLEDLYKYYRAARRTVKDGGFSMHCIHHFDHNSRHQASLNKLSYLKYNDWFYDILQSRRFNYQNRLRHNEFLAIEAECGFKVLKEILNSEPKEALSDVNISKRFQSIPIEDLLVTRTQIISLAV